MEDELRLFDDLPLFGEGEVGKVDAEEERFGHWAYARTLAKILKENDKPLTIGLFGKWGTGKSTIVNMLLNEIRKDKETAICPVVFNAWRHQDDSFRRQLLIAVGREIYGEGDRKYRELTDLTGVKAKHVDVEEETEEKMPLKRLWSSLRKFFKWLVSDAKSARLTLIGILLWVIITIGGCVVVYYCPGGVGQFMLTSLVVPVVLILMGVVEKGTRRKLVAMLDIRQPQGEKPRLSYPEQFEMEFVKCVEALRKDKRRLLVVVDDLDRCDESAVVAALAVIKQFAGKFNCVFIVPCDEKQVIKAVSTTGSDHDYGNESLRKFFDVAVRMDDIPEADLHNYAKYLVKQWKLSPRLAEMAVYSGAHDARKVKAFLNSFKTRYWMIKEREPRYFEKGTAKRNLELIAKLTALQEGFPEFYEKVCDDPTLLGKVERELRMPASISPYEEGPEVDVKGVTEGNEVLKRFLRYIGDIDLGEISDIVVGKRPEVIAGISTGPDVLAALSEGDEGKFVEAVRGLDKAQGEKLVEYIKQKIREYGEQRLTASLRMLVHCVLGVFSRDGIWESEDSKGPKRSLGDAVVEAIEQDKGLVKQSGDLKGLESLLTIASKPSALADNIVETYLKGTAAPEGASYLALFNRKSTYFEKELGRVNEAVEKTLATEAEEEMLKQLVSPMVRETRGEAVPSPEVINAVVGRLEAIDEAYGRNKMRVEVVRTYPERVAWGGFVKKWSELTSKAQSSAVHVEKTNFGLALDALDEVSRVTKEDGETVCSGVLSIWSHNGEEPSRKRVLLTFGTIYPLLKDASAEKVRYAVFEWLSARPVAEIRDYLEKLTTGWERFPEEKRRILKKLAATLLEELVGWVIDQPDTYNDRVENVVNLIVEWDSTLKNETLLRDLVETVIRGTNDATFERWHKKALGNLCDHIGKESLQQLGERVIVHVEDAQTTRQRRSLLLDTLITKLSPEDFDGIETDKVFRLFWHDDSNIREPVCEKFESLKGKFQKNDLNRNMAIMARKIADSSTDKIIAKANSVTAFLKNAEHLSKQDKAQILSTVPALIHSTNPKGSINVGLQMLEKIGVEGDVTPDILSGLEALRGHSDENLKQRAIELMDRFGQREKGGGERGVL